VVRLTERPCRRNHALCSDYATQNQERRASARRGIEKRICNGE